MTHHRPTTTTNNNIVAETLLDPEESRMTIYPIRHKDIWDMYQKAVAAFWVPAEVDLTKDINDWNVLSDNERFFISNVLAFFGSSDTIVNINLGERFLNEIQIQEAKFFYGFQIAIENIHSEMYSLLIDTYIKDPIQKDKLLNAVQSVPCIKSKADWCFKWINDDVASFAQRLLAFAIVEGVFFSGAFASIFWLKEKGVMPGLAFSNELISRDEALHVEFALLLYSKVQNRVPQELVHAMFKEAVDVEKNFIIDSIPCSLLGMNADLMSTYIEFVADRLLVQCDYEKLYNAVNPFPFMERISIQNRTNFFESRVAEYSKANVGRSGNVDPQSIYEFSLDADF
jgi:ribonucleotide reductase beta subunit family protein with ferritin-like domain